MNNGSSLTELRCRCQLSQGTFSVFSVLDELFSSSQQHFDPHQDTQTPARVVVLIFWTSQSRLSKVKMSALNVIFFCTTSVEALRYRSRQVIKSDSKQLWAALMLTSDHVLIGSDLREKKKTQNKVDLRLCPKQMTLGIWQLVCGVITPNYYIR